MISHKILNMFNDQPTLMAKHMLKVLMANMMASSIKLETMCITTHLPHGSIYYIAIARSHWECDLAAKNEAVYDKSDQIELAIMLLYVLFAHDIIIL